MEPHHAEERATGEPVIVIDATRVTGTTQLIAVDRRGDYRTFELGQLTCTEAAYRLPTPAPEVEPEHEHDFSGTGRPVLAAGRLVSIDIPCTGCPEVLRKPPVGARQAALG